MSCTAWGMIPGLVGVPDWIGISYVSLYVFVMLDQLTSVNVFPEAV
jgi:hypothetical protein